MTSRPLVVRLCNWIGDVVLSLPALQHLQSAGYALHLYGKGWAPTLLSGYGWPVTVRAKTLGERVLQLKLLRQQLAINVTTNAATNAAPNAATNTSAAASHTNACSPGLAKRINALAMPNSFSSALELRLAGLRVAGYARDGRSLLLAHRVAAPEAPHALESFWALAAGLTGRSSAPPADIHLQIAPAALAHAQALVAQRGWGAGYVCIAPFAAGTVHKHDKRWPGFPELTRRLAAQGLTVVVCPGPGEAAVALRDHPQAQVLQALPLDAYAALLQGSRLVVANDTGPGHIAAASGAPLLSVLGPTKVEQWRPWGSQVSVLSARPHWPTVDAVHAAVNTRLAR